MPCGVFFNLCILNVTVPSGQGNDSKTEDMEEKGKPLSGAGQIAAIAVISTLVLMAAILPFLIWSLLGGKGKGKFHI